jgi:hypothetical protein
VPGADKHNVAVVSALVNARVVWILLLSLMASIFPMAMVQAQDQTLAKDVPLKVTVPGDGRADPTTLYYYYTQLIRLALEKTRATDGDYELDFLPHNGGIERDRAMLMAGVGIDVMWASVTRERAEKLRVVDVDILKNLNNFRALLIHKDNRVKFSQIETLEQLRQFKTGTGPFWTDGIILKDNGFTLVYGANYTGLFKMLAKNRFEFFTRGLHELQSDLLAFNYLGLMQEPRLLLQYDRPVRYCFFVNKDNQKLAERLERGLRIAQADGSFEKLFMSMPSFRYGAEILRDPKRVVLTMTNQTGF